MIEQELRLILSFLSDELYWDWADVVRGQLNYQRFLEQNPNLTDRADRQYRELLALRTLTVNDMRNINGVDAQPLRRGGLWLL